MPIDYKNYPANWKTVIRPDILKRAKDCCEDCGLKNYSVGSRVNGKFIPTAGNITHDKAGNGELGFKLAMELVKHCNESCDDKLIIIVLTIAHLDHDITNNDYNNLKALCQKCHLNYDKEHHSKNSRATRNFKKGLQELF